ncbi:hypothetical protein, partial [Halorubrum sp. DTA98]|uniref:hypothetical protein n=1 Tax=Halorubrum sp. DTA98 TaxID=3402163 RepID=UPI003AAEEAB8
MELGHCWGVFISDLARIDDERLQSPSRSLISGLPRNDGKHLQSPSRDDSRALLRASLASLAAVSPAALPPAARGASRH